MPAGLAKVLELLRNSLDVSDPKGTLEINAAKLKTTDRLIATYKNKDGLYDSAAITVVEGGMTPQKDGDSVVVDLTDVAPGIYTLKAGEQEVKVEVIASEAAAEVAA